MSNSFPFNPNVPPVGGFPFPPTFMPPNMTAMMPPNIPVPTNIAVPPIQPPDNPWTEHTSQDGRIYFFNIITKQSTWEKPDELKSLSERILSECPWKEFQSEEGKTYYYNTESKQSVWNKPQELIDAENKAKLASEASEQEPKVESIKNEENSNSEVSAIDEAILKTLGSIDNIDPPPEKPKEEIEKKEEISNTSSIPVPERHIYNTKEEMEEGWKQLLRDLNVPGNANWETAVKLISADPRYNELKKFNQRKQIFNNYKTQRQKEEREEARLKAKQAKEDLEKFLTNHPKLSSAIVYRKAEVLLADCPEWIAVPDRDRREIYEDSMTHMTKREKEKAKTLRKRNIKLFNEILDEMPNLTFKTTWFESQRILLDNARFVEDEDLQSMDKEDALICFEEHIRLLEKDYEEEKERERRRIRRQHRKNRESFLVFLDELHDSKRLTSLSMWKDLYSVISQDDRFYKMLSQPGSTPLDLFKFYVLNLKSQYSRDKKIVKEILEAKKFTVELTTTLDEFLFILTSSNDDRLKQCDQGNIKMAYTSMIEKVEMIEKQRRKEQMKLMKKKENAFKDLLHDNQIGATNTWEDVVEKLSNKPEFQAIDLESTRLKYYKEYLLSLPTPVIQSDLNNGVAKTTVSSDVHSSNNMVKHKKRKHDSSGGVDVPKKKKKKKHAHSDAESDGQGDDKVSKSHKKSHKKKKKKKKQHRHGSVGGGNDVSDADNAKTKESIKPNDKNPEKNITNDNNIDQPPSEGEVVDDEDEDVEHLQRKTLKQHSRSPRRGANDEKTTDFFRN